MLSLPPELDEQCFALFLLCDEFNSTNSLRAVFTTPDLAWSVAGLPERTGSRRDFAAQVKLFLQEERLTNGPWLLLPFLDTLRGRYPEEDDSRRKLNDLYQQVLEYCLTDAERELRTASANGRVPGTGRGGAPSSPLESSPRVDTRPARHNV